MLKVLKAGLRTTIQDNGRFGYKHFGVPSSGCLDQYSANLANMLLGNPNNSAVLEATIMGPTLEFSSVTQLCICGADMSPKLNNNPITNNHVFNIKAGDVLNFGHLNYGARVYIAIKDGFQTQVVMDSRSYYQNITLQEQIEKGDLIDYSETKTQRKAERAPVKIDKNHFESIEIKCLVGPEFSLLSSVQKKRLLEQEFSLSKEYSRMGFQLNELLNNELPSILSSAVLPGTVQLTSSGKLIVLMRDCQTTGGYPRVLQLTEHAINRLAQKKTNDKIQFKLINV